MSAASLFARRSAASFSARIIPSSAAAFAPATARLSFRRNLSDDLRARLDTAVKSNDVLVFMKGNKAQPQCGFSRAVVQILTLQGVKDFKTVNVLADEEVRTGIKEYSSWPTIPQVYVKGEFVGGCDILINMHQSGELDTFLKEQGIAVDKEAAEAAAEEQKSV
ncbi:mitochondrial monothiol glutaredoxin-5-like protein [Geranomyces variabilis]|nr:mitochondrial monothiol glutaredoxin-5-like protein [Geranomyces variabilis]KAJ3134637.1 monothiol glutaredoxin grx5 [Geranomyces variabilis]